MDGYDSDINEYRRYLGFIRCEYAGTQVITGSDSREHKISTAVREFEPELEARLLGAESGKMIQVFY